VSSQYLRFTTHVARHDMTGQVHRHSENTLSDNTASLGLGLLTWVPTQKSHEKNEGEILISSTRLHKTRNHQLTKREGLHGYDDHMGPLRGWFMKQAGCYS
jgi:hypothetical protein